MDDYYASRLESQHFDGNICDYLNISVTYKKDYDNLTGKFDVLDSVDPSPSLFERIFRPMIHQIVVAKCAYQFKLEQLAVNFLPSINIKINKKVFLLYLKF